MTRGWFDTRGTALRVPLPEDLAGRRCLDVGTWDGFWAFEMERRGASEVVGIDLDDPTRWDWPADHRPEGRDVLESVKSGNQGFAIAREALGSSVDRRFVSAYELDPAEHGMFDVVFLGSLLLHLRDPVGALNAIRGVCRGILVVCDTIDPLLTITHPRTPAAILDGTVKPWWWTANAPGLRRMVEAAGFHVDRRPRVVRVATGAVHPRPAIRECLPFSQEGRNKLAVRFWGIPHATLLARPGSQ